MHSKKQLILGSLAGTLGFLVTGMSRQISICPSASYSDCAALWDSIAETLTLFLPLFVFSLITYKMPENISRIWMYFALPWTALSIILAFLTPEYSGGGFGPSISFGKSDVALIMSSLFCLISTLIIGGMYLRIGMSRKKI